jgi:thiosulfate/3-mercaptopyruvate sulfurtransferase
MAGLPSGHMPNSLSVPFTDLIDPETKILFPREKLQAIFKEKGVDPNKPTIVSCGTGVTAAVVDAALDEAGFTDSKTRRLYDGSWT